MEFVTDKDGRVWPLSRLPSKFVFVDISIVGNRINRYEEYERLRNFEIFALKDDKVNWKEEGF